MSTCASTPSTAAEQGASPVMPEHLHVVAAAIRNTAGEYLLTRRGDHQHQGGLWEFPGGKVEPGETREAALARELQEELGITPRQARPLIGIPHAYGDKRVFLDVWLVTAYYGEPHPHEGQPMRWVPGPELSRLAFPAANRPILTALDLPARYLITPEPDTDARFLDHLEQALAAGIRLVQLRCHGLPEAALEALAARALALVHRHGGRLLLNSDPALARRLGADGVHLSAARLRSLDPDAVASLRAGPGGFLVAASCHDADELARAAAIGADFAVLAPVAATRTHPEACPLGWDAFAALVRNTPLPVYALGGMGEADLAVAQTQGAQGIAAIRALWPGVF